MTTRYLTTDQNGNGDQTYWDINGYFLHGPSGEKLNLGGGNTTVTASNEIVQIGTSYIRIPQGISNERPNPSYAGMIRYLTSEDLIEYYNASDLEWQRIGIGAPAITSVSPTILNQGTSNTISLTGKNFNTFSNIQLIGTDSSIFIPDTVNNTLGSTNLTFTCLSGNTILDNSSVEPFYIKVTNSDTGFSTETSPILNINQGSFFILPPGPNLGTFPVQDPCANFYIQGGDTDHPNGNDVSFAIVSANPTPGGFVLTNTSDISATFAPASGSRTDASAQTYNFSCQMTDISGAKSTVQSFNFSLANPVISSINPSSIYDSSLINITITGNYFVIDSSISFINSVGNLLTYSEVSYNSTTSLTVKDLSGGSGPTGQYDISVNNGSVVTSNPSVFLSIIALVGFSITPTSNLSQTPAYVDSGNNLIGGPVPGGYTILILKCSSTSSNASGSISVDKNLSGNVTFLIIGGGGSGGYSIYGGGGGAGDVLIASPIGSEYSLNTGTNTNLTSSSRVSFGSNNSYSFQIGRGGNTANSSNYFPGQDSTLAHTGGTLTASGGRGGGYGAVVGQSGNGSGGGGAGVTNGGTGSGTNVSNGGRGDAGNDEGGGGGGGANANGGNGVGDNRGGAGGAGFQNITIEGTSKSYAGGGGGGIIRNRTSGTGGVGGGGRGGGNQAPTAGTSHTGSGGGGYGSGGTSTGNGAAGGSGIIVIRFPSFA